MSRHKAHIAGTLNASREARELASIAAILDQLRTIHGRAMNILDRTEQSNDHRTALAAVREVRGVLATMAELLVSRELERHVEALERMN